MPLVNGHTTSPKRTVLRAHGMAHTASPSWLWGDRQFCDVQLQLCTPQHLSDGSDEETLPHTASTAKSGCTETLEDSSAASRYCSVESEATQASIRSLSLHANILAGASRYFTARMTGWAAGGGGDRGGGNDGGKDDGGSVCPGNRVASSGGAGYGNRGSGVVLAAVAGAATVAAVTAAVACGEVWRRRRWRGVAAAATAAGAAAAAAAAALDAWRLRGTSSGTGKPGSSGIKSSPETTLAPTDAAAAGAAAPAGVRWLLVEHVEEDEVETMVAVLRHCYYGTLCVRAVNTPQLDVVTLLRMAVLADRFDVPLCLAHCCGELAGRGACYFDIPAINLALGGLPPGLYSPDFHRAVVAIATERLLHLFGDSEAVCGAWYSPDRDLDAQLLQLSLPSFLVLLGSDSLKARSENSVLMMADAWASGPPGAACSPAQLRQVAEVIRLGQLTHAFTFEVLKRLPWLQLTDEEHDSLLLYNSVGAPAGGDGAAERQARLVERGHTCGPAAWYDGRRRVRWPNAEGVTATWQVTTAELTAFLGSCLGAGTETVRLHGPRVFFNGFTLSPALVVVVGAAQPLQRAAWFGVDVKVLRGGSKGRDVACRDVAVRVTVRLAGPGDKSTVRVWDRSLSSSRVAYVLQPSLVPARRVLDVTAWALYMLEGGKVHVRCTVSTCI